MRLPQPSPDPTFAHPEKPLLCPGHRAHSRTRNVALSAVREFLLPRLPRHSPLPRGPPPAVGSRATPGARELGRGLLDKQPECSKGKISGRRDGKLAVVDALCNRRPCSFCSVRIFEKNLWGIRQVIGVQRSQLYKATITDDRDFTAARTMLRRKSGDWLVFVLAGSERVIVSNVKLLPRKPRAFTKIAPDDVEPWLRKQIPKPQQIKRLNSTWEIPKKITDFEWMGQHKNTGQVIRDLVSVGYEVGDEITDPEFDYLRGIFARLRSERERPEPEDPLIPDMPIGKPKRRSETPSRKRSFRPVRGKPQRSPPPGVADPPPPACPPSGTKVHEKPGPLPNR